MNKLIAGAFICLPLLLVGCGNDNEAACKDYVQKVQDCGGAFAATYSESWCEAYSETSCDIADYFDCLGDALGTCSNGNFGEADATALSACASKAACD